MPDHTLKQILEKRGLERVTLTEFGQSGVKGQKWGVTRTKKQLRSAAKTRGDKPKLKKGAKKMTNDELESHIKRMNLEKKYTDLASDANKKAPTRMSRGTKAVGDVMKQSATSALKTHSTNIMTKGLTKQIQKKYPKYEIGGKKKKSSSGGS